MFLCPLPLLIIKVFDCGTFAGRKLMEKWSKPFAPALYQTLVHSFAFLLAATRQRQKAKGKRQRQRQRQRQGNGRESYLFACWEGKGKAKKFLILSASFPQKKLNGETDRKLQVVPTPIDFFAFCAHSVSLFKNIYKTMHKQVQVIKAILYSLLLIIHTQLDARQMYRDLDF